MIAFKELNLPYLHHASMPGSPELYEFSPLGKIPVLVHVRILTDTAPQRDLRGA